MSKNDDDFEKVHWWPFWLILLFVVSSWFLFVMEWFPWWTEENARGTFGDSFGVVNALFSGLAFAGVIYAILLQKKELELQRKELKLQRKTLEATEVEIRGQKEQLQAQNETLQKQNFESSFFQLLTIHNDIVNSMKIRQNEEFGRECLSSVFRNLPSRYNTAQDRARNDISKTKLDIINDAFEPLFSENRSLVDHYFRHLHHVVKFVDDQRDFPKEFKEKKLYTDFIRAQLSSPELGFLFYYGLSKRGTEFGILVKKYDFFEDVPSEVLIDEEHRNLYAEIASDTSG